MFLSILSYIIYFHMILSETTLEPITKPVPTIEPETPERIKESPIPMPNPFVIPTPTIKPGVAPIPKA